MIALFIYLCSKYFRSCNSFPDSRTYVAVDEHEELKKSFVKQGQDLRLYYNQVLELKGIYCQK